MDQTQADKNLQNTVHALEQTPVNSHQAQQLQQDKMDRRKQSMKNHKGYKSDQNQYQ